jgi:hypothetical protein
LLNGHVQKLIKSLTPNLTVFAVLLGN